MVGHAEDKTSNAGVVAYTKDKTPDARIIDHAENKTSNAGVVVYTEAKAPNARIVDGESHSSNASSSSWTNRKLTDTKTWKLRIIYFEKNRRI